MSTDNQKTAKHLTITQPGQWVARFVHLIPKGGVVLDLAAGNGRHTKLALDLGHAVLAIDRDIDPLAPLADRDGLEVIQSDLEDGHDPFGPGGCLYQRRFSGIIVSNYLYRPQLPHLVAAVDPGGALIYDTFARGNETFSKPRNPDHLLKSGELLAHVQGKLQVIAYEHGIVRQDACPGVKSRICATNTIGQSTREDGEAEPRALHPE